jgi:hypothetical protein
MYVRATHELTITPHFKLYITSVPPNTLNHISTMHVVGNIKNTSRSRHILHKRNVWIVSRSSFFNKKCAKNIAYVLILLKINYTTFLPRVTTCACTAYPERFSFTSVVSLSEVLSQDGHRGSRPQPITIRSTIFKYPPRIRMRYAIAWVKVAFQNGDKSHCTF